MMKNLKYISLSALVVASTIVNAGNPERRGQAGASQLLINPYARNSGMVGSNSAKVRGLEAQFLNIAGTAYTRKTEVIFNRSTWLQGTDIFINAFGLTQGIGETSSKLEVCGPAEKWIMVYQHEIHWTSCEHRCTPYLENHGRRK